jgi:hypothetical protein
VGAAPRPRQEAAPSVTKAALYLLHANVSMNANSMIATAG